MNRKITPIFFCFLLFAFNSFAQQVLKGKVTESGNGTGIPGASVLVKGTTTGTSTQPDGTFSITLPANATTIVVKYLGFVSQELSINNQAVINVVLVQDAASLSEVVVTALGIRRSDKSIGYATQTVKGDNLTLTKEQNVLGSLAGKVAGVQVVGSSGASMGGSQKVKIRGVNSLNASSSPLIVVDGTPISDTNFSTSTGNGVDLGNISQDINPEDIESLNVLKGPAASALYGIRGQYGVIMITTKKGAKGPKKVDFRFNSGFSIEKTGNFMPLQNIYGVGNSQTFATLNNGQKYIDGNDESWGPKMDGTPVRMYYSFYPQDAQFGELTPFIPHPDNIKDFYETGYNLNNSISVTGGNENSSFRLSYNNAYINGVVPNTWLKRNNISLSSDLKLNDKLTVGVNANYANNSGQRPTQGYQGSFTGGVQWFQRNIDMNRLRNYKYPDGTIMNWNAKPDKATGLMETNKPSDWNNPFFDAYESINNDNRDRLFGDVNLSYQVLPELKLSAFARSDRFTQNISHKEAAGGRLFDGYSVGKYQGIDNNFEFLGQYNKQFGDLSVTGNVGTNLYTTKLTKLFQATVNGLSSPDFYSIEASIDRPTSTSYERRKEVRSAYAMASLGYKDTYFLDASIRNDNSSALPKNNNSYWYPSVSGSFVFSELLKWKPLSFAKLRASYAVAGSDLDPYQIEYTYSAGSVYKNTATNININSLYVPDKLNNPNIKPAFAKSYELGTDLKFLNNRVGMEFTYYKQRSENQVIDLSVSGGSGFTSTIVNAGIIENQGIELSLTANPVKSKLFSWETTLNFNRNKSIIKELYEDQNVYRLDANVYSNVNIYLNATVNKSFGSLVGQAYQRDPQTGKILLGADNMPLVETNHDFGSVLPRFTGGVMNTFRIGKFDLSAMIDFQSGGQFFSWSKMLAVKSGQAAETAVLNDKGFNVRDPLANGGGVKLNGIYGPGVTIGGQNVAGQEFNGYVDARTYFRNNIGTKIYEEWLFDASYVKLREVSLAYNFTGELLKKSPFKSAKLAVVARNPVMIWQKAPKGLDPSELSTGSASISWLEKGELQTVRSYGVNLNLTF